MPLNINLQQILLHALNFVILFGALYFLLYKPVRDFMDSRKAHYEKMDADAKAALAQAEKTKEDFAAQMKNSLCSTLCCATTAPRPNTRTASFTRIRRSITSKKRTLALSR